MDGYLDNDGKSNEPEAKLKGYIPKILNSIISNAFSLTSTVKITFFSMILNSC